MDNRDAPLLTALTRRRLLQGLGALTVTGLATDLARQPRRYEGTTAAGHQRPMRTIADIAVGSPWSDPASWPSGQVPSAGSTVVISKPVVLDTDAVVGRLVIESAGTLIFSPSSSRTLQSRGNVEVRGSLVMRPASGAVRHTLRFIDIDESRFVGGGMNVLASDVGLWVVGAGTIDLTGAPKSSWTRAQGTLAAGAKTIVVDDASGWRVGDSLVIAPTTPPTLDNGSMHQDIGHCLTYDEAVIVGVATNTVTLDRPLVNPHPVVRFADWTGQVQSYGAEVLNLTRNVVVEGTPNGRTHVMFVETEQPQALSHVEIRHVGPRQTNPNNVKKTQSVLGRYALHFHHCHDGSRGSVFDGVVVHHCGGHAFVPHDSHGVTFNDCVAHDTMDTPFWWDLSAKGSTYKPESHDMTWRGCVASKVWADKTTSEEYRMAGFNFGEGNDFSNSCIDCVAIGVRGTDSVMNNAAVSGYHWPSQGKAIWNFSGCLAHNIGGSGLLTWENDERVHLLETFTAYYCGKVGIDHGAYNNYWQYRKCAAYGNRRSGLAIAAVTRRTSSTSPTAPPLAFEDIIIDGAGISLWGIQSDHHVLDAPATDPALITRARVSRCRGASFYEPANARPSNIRLVDCTFDGSTQFRFDDAVPAKTRVQVDNLNGSGGSFVLRQRDQPGTYVPEWNARRS